MFANVLTVRMFPIYVLASQALAMAISFGPLAH